MSEGIVEFLMFAAVALNIVVTVYLLAITGLEKSKKIAQIVVVWLCPFVAASALWWFHRKQSLIAAASSNEAVSVNAVGDAVSAKS